MKHLAIFLAAVLCLATGAAAWAEAPLTSPRPAPRGGAAEVLREVLPEVLPLPALPARAPVATAASPSPRGDGWAILAAGSAGPGTMPAAPATPRLSERVSTSGVLVSPRPPRRALDATPRESTARAMPHPRPRPASLVRPQNPARNVTVVQPATRLAVLRSPRPSPRPENHLRRSVVRASGLVPTQPSPRAIIGKRGSVCGDPRIRGEALAPIAGRIRGCGLEAPVRITSVGGVGLSAPATVDCTTAQALTDWVDDVVKPTVGRLGGGVASLQVFADYSCRTRNNQPGAKVSEHGRGRAIDIGAINLANGSSLTVLDHWRSDDLGSLLKAMHRGACSKFGTVLGPQADRFHQNHFHLDTARYRSGSYCR